MRRMRGRGWIVNAFLWVCPLVGAAAFIVGLLAGRAPPAVRAIPGERFFDVPGAVKIAILVAALAVPLVVACATRRAGGYLAGTSFVLLAMMMAAWSRSHWADDRVTLAWGDTGIDRPAPDKWEAISTSGGVGLFRQRWLLQLSTRSSRGQRLSPGRDRIIAYWQVVPGGFYPAGFSPFDATPQWLRRLGFAMAIKPDVDWNPSHGGTTFALALPYWFLCLLAAPLPLAWLNRQRRRRRANAGACVRCGYDLRATPDRCPECGTIPAP